MKKTLQWHNLLKVQIPVALLLLFTLLGAAIFYTLESIQARKHDYAILNLAGQLRVLTTSLIAQSEQYKINAPRDYPSYHRDLKLYATDMKHHVERYDEIITAFKERKLNESLTGLKSPLTCSWDKKSISQLDITAENWFQFKQGLFLALGENLDEPRLEFAADYIIQQSVALAQATDNLTTEFRAMMQSKLDSLTRTIRYLLILSVMLLLSLLSLLYFRLLKPLTNTVNGIRNITDGDIGHTINITTNNELALLNDAVNTMSSSLNAIFTLTSHVNSTSSLDDALKTVYEQFSEISPICWCGLFSVNATRTEIKLERLFANYNTQMTEGQCFNFEGSLMADLVEDGNTRIVNDLQQIIATHPQSAVAEMYRHDHIQSALFLPLTTKFKDDSVILLGSHKTNAFDESKIRLMNFIGTQLTHSFEKNVVMESLVISAVEGLAKLAESRDPETGDHLLRMSIYSSIIAQQLKKHSPYSQQIDNHFIRNILRFAPMHDIGKVGIEDSILLKPGQLSEEQRLTMQQHPVIGGDVLRRCERQMNQVGHQIFTLGIEIADAHHEKFDGSGYPNQLRAQQIPLSARIVAVADVFDALTSKRPYKEAWPIDKALQLLDQESGKHFDPVVIEAFRQALPEIMKVYQKHKHV